MKSNYKILMVDDDPNVTEIVKMVLADRFQTGSLLNPLEALEHLKTNKYDLILLDYFMPEMSGEEFTEEFRKFDQVTPIILITGYAEEDHPLELLDRMDIQGYFDKTNDPETLYINIVSLFNTLEIAKR